VGSECLLMHWLGHRASTRETYHTVQLVMRPGWPPHAHMNDCATRSFGFRR